MYKAEITDTAHKGCDTCKLYGKQAQSHLRRAHEESGQTTYTRKHIINGVFHFATAVVVEVPTA